jgi:hypothetical protein
MNERFAPPDAGTQYPQDDFSYSSGPGLSGFPIIFILASFFFMLIFLLLLPIALTMNISLWASGDSIFNSGLSNIQQISDSAVRESVAGVFSSSSGAFLAGQSIIGFFASWGWMFIIVGTIVVILLLARREVETGMV